MAAGSRLLLLFLPIACAVRPSEDYVYEADVIASDGRKKHAGAIDATQHVAPLLSSSDHQQHALFNAGGASILLHLGDRSTMRSQAAPQNFSASAGIKAGYVELLFNAIDDHGGPDGIKAAQWKTKVGHKSGTQPKWKTIIWTVMDVDKSKAIEYSEFVSNWPAAVSKVFEDMGGKDDGAIDLDEIRSELWKGVSPQEMGFAVANFVEDDGHMDGREMEEFLFTVLMFRAIDAADSHFVTWEQVQHNQAALQAFHGKKELEKLKTKYGEPSHPAKGMDINLCYGILKSDLGVFVQA